MFQAAHLGHDVSAVSLNHCHTFSVMSVKFLGNIMTRVATSDNNGPFAGIFGPTRVLGGMMNFALECFDSSEFGNIWLAGVASGEDYVTRM